MVSPSLRAFDSADVRLAGMLSDAASKATGLLGPQLFLRAFEYVLQREERFRDLKKQMQALAEIEQNAREDSTLINDVLNALEKKGSRYQLIQYPQETI